MTPFPERDASSSEGLWQPGADVSVSAPRGDFYYHALQFPETVNNYPDVLCLLGIAGCVVLFISTFVSKKYKTGDEDDHIAKVQLVRLVVSIALVALYIILFKPLGYVLSTLVFSLAEMWLLKPSFKKLPMIIIALVTVAIMFFAFGRLLHVFLPTLWLYPYHN